MGTTIAMNVYDAPQRPQETYTQGFWYGVMAAILYLICSMILMINMLGYFLGHYGQHFNLSEAQRTLILQTMMFFIWLAGGAGVFARVESTIGNQGWIFTDALYFCKSPEAIRSSTSFIRPKEATDQFSPRCISHRR